MPTFKKSIFMSIKPKYCYQIFKGEKTLEIRKTKPEILQTPFDVYVYCTMPDIHHQTICGHMRLNDDELYIHPKEGLKHGDSIELMACDDAYSKDNFLNGKCIGKLTIDYIQRLRYPEDRLVDVIDAKEACLSAKEIIEYSRGKPLFGWHIKEANLFKRPLLADTFPTFKTVQRPPQSWQYVMINIDAFEKGEI